MDPRPHLLPLRYCLLALDRLGDDPETKPPGIAQASNLRTILAQANSLRELGRRCTVWDRLMGVSLDPH